jgi:hypothetical protein
VGADHALQELLVRRATDLLVGRHHWPPGVAA